MKVIVQAVPSRQEYVDYLKERLPDAIIVWDQGDGPHETLKEVLRVTGNGPAIHLEDDVILTKNFLQKAREAIEGHEDVVVQMFSMRKKDLTHGSRQEYAGTYLMNQCRYVPPFFAANMLGYLSHHSVDSNLEIRANPDVAVREFMKAYGMKYWLHCPSLVNHRVGVSALNKSRAKTNRQSFTFKDPWT